MQRSLVWLVVVALIVPTTAHAHGHSADAFSSFMTEWGSRLSGFHQMVAITIDSGNRDFAILGDYAGLKGEENNQEASRHSYMGGVRWTVNGNDTNRHLLMVHVLGGAVIKHLGVDASTKPGFALGASYEWIPESFETFAMRIQVDGTRAGGKNSARLSIGAVLRVPH